MFVKEKNKDLQAKTLNDIFEIDFKWNVEVEKCSAYTNVWYDGLNEENEDVYVNIRFLYYSIPGIAKKFDQKSYLLYKRKAFPLCVEIHAKLDDRSLGALFGVGTEEYYAVFEFLAQRFDRLKRYYDYSCQSAISGVKSFTSSTIGIARNANMLYQYDYMFINAILDLTKKKQIHWIEKDMDDYNLYVGSIETPNGKKTIEIERVWIEAENQRGRDPYLYKVTSGAFSRLFFLGTKIGYLIWEIILRMNDRDPERMFPEYLQYVVSNDSESAT
ncbi:MAG: hypothetical protein IJM54_02500 [Thermoguttaceae bacterium]|nr:hypothetical protein [Thermoguttaceae bacterium]